VIASVPWFRRAKDLRAAVTLPAADHQLFLVVLKGGLLPRYGSAVLDRRLTLVAVSGMLLLVAGVMVLWLIG
jgi:hypothetical protein